MVQAKKTEKAERSDGRKLNEMRKMEAKVGIIKRADGSAMFKIGTTVALAAVYGPRELFPGFMQNPEKGILRCNYDMLSFSVTERKRPGPSRRSVEISLVTKNALGSAINLDQFPNTVVDVFIMIVQADAGTRCAGITAASMALADAGIPMRDLVSAVSVGRINGKIVIDLDKEEEDYDGTTDIPCAFMSRNNEITLLQLDGDISAEELKQAVELGKEGCKQISEIQKKALKERYKEIKNE
ncbi:exosome complex exonuclease Rrp41 [Candidatus Woesearchaeota archaeon]|nr:exosome complex exonuclease Rrp41 [Candidatus Woesearchaeota archaeon]